MRLSFPITGLTLLFCLSAPVVAQAEVSLAPLSVDTYENGTSPTVYPVANRTMYGHRSRHMHRHLVAHRSAARTMSPAL